MTIDPIPALQAFGYTEREAAFLYLVATHSGYFLRRQFDWFIDRNKGSIVMRFLAKAHAAGHIESLDYEQGWHVYHLCARTLYRLRGDLDSPLRRRKGDAQMRLRLMALDYILANELDHYLVSEADRIRYFGQVRRIPTDFFEDDGGRLHPLLTAFPISLIDRGYAVHSLVRFTFIDEGLVDIDKFLRFLDATEALLRSVGNFEVVYISNSESIFPSAREAFWSRFKKSLFPAPGLFGEGARYASAPSNPPLQAHFTTVLFRHSYPSFRRSKAKGSEKVRRRGEVGAGK